MSQNSTDRNTLSVNLLASLAATDNQFDPTPAAPGVVNIDTVKDDVGQKTGVIGNEGLTDDLTPTLGGFVDGGAGIVISIYANTEFLGHATIGDDGFWSFTPEQPLEVNQEYIFQTLVQDPGSDALLISLPYKVYTIETNGDVPATISLDSIVDNIRGFYGYTGALPDDGRGLTNDAHPDLSGKANAGARVNVYDNGTLIGSTTVGADGSWKFTPATALKDGTHVLVATVVTAIGESSPTAGFTITVDTVNSQPILDTVQDNVGTVQTLVSNGGLTDDSRPVLTGHAEAGSRVDIHVFGPNGKALYYQSVTAGNDGSWTYQPKAFTTHGNYSFGITGIDQAGNAWRTYGDKFTVKYVGSNQDDTSVPDAATGLVLHDDVGSIKTDIQNKGITDDSKPTLSGHADAGDIVLVYDNNKVIGSATVASNGNWSFTPATALNDGSHSFTTVVKNVDNGHTSAASAAIGFTVDTVITAPVITGVWDNVGTKTGNVANGGVTDDILPKISGTAEAGSMVTITLTGPAGQRYTYDAVQADQNGNWHYYVVGELGWTAGNSRAFTFTATAADVAGNVSHSSEKYVINYVDSNQDDTSVPDAATGLVLHDDVGSIKTDIQNKGITDDSKPALSGHADAGDIVLVYDNNKVIGSATAASNGTWSFTPATALNDGSHSFTTVVKDAVNGHTSVASAAIGFTVDTVIAAPVITGVADDVGTKKGNVANGGLTDDNSPLISGTAEAGSTVTIYAMGPKGAHYTVGSVVADSAGHWSIDSHYYPGVSGVKGNWTFTAWATDEAGNHSAGSGNYVVKYVGSNQDAPATISLDSIVDNNGGFNGHQFTGALPHDGRGLTDDVQPDLSGKANAGARVNVYDNGTLIGSTTAGADGSWKFTPATALKNGTHVLAATVVTASGESSPTAGFTVTVDTVISQPVIDTVQDNAGNTQGLVSNGGLTDDSRPVLTGHAEAGSRVDIHVFGPGGKELYHQSVTAGNDGSWTYQPEAFTTHGNYSFGITGVDQAGNAWRDYGNKFTVKYVGSNQDAPATISLDSIVDNNGGFNGHQFTGALPHDGRGLTDDVQPDLSGKANAGARVNVYDNGTLIGSTTAGADGSWKFTPATALKNGTHVLAATVVTASGESSPTAGFTVTVDTVISQPVIDTVQDNAGNTQGLVSNGGLTDDSRPVLTGHAEAGSRVDIHVFGPGGKELYHQSVTAGNDGSWTYQPEAFTTHGNYSFGITGVDQAGNAWRDYGNKFTVKYVGSNQDDTSVPDAATGLVLHDDVGRIKTDIQNKGITDDSKPALSGHADAGDIVLVYDNNKVIGSATAASNGNWSFTPATALKDGSHSFTTVVKDAVNGHTSATSAAIGFTVDTVITAPVITGVWDNVGTKTGNVANGGVTDDTLPRISGTAEAGSMVTITMTAPAGLHYTYDAVQADQNGNWHYDVVGALGWKAGNSRAFTFTATAADVAGNVSQSSEKYVINYVDSNQDDTSVPDAATGLVLHDDVGSIKGDIHNNGITDDSKPALSGHADAGDIVLVYDNNKVIGSATAASNGTWSFTPATALNDGSHSFTTVVKDAVNGHTSAASAAIHFTVDTHIAAPVITGATDDVGPRTGEISNGGTTDDSRPVMHGTAEAGATVNIYDGNNELRGQSIADSHGNWSVELAYSAVNITAGARNYYAVAESGSGATSAHSNSWLIWYAQETPTAFAENFNELQNQAFSNSAVYQLAHFDVSVAQHGNTSAYSPGFNDTHYGVSRPVSSRAMTFTEGTKVTLDMHNPVSDISFKIGDLTTNESLSVTYYDAHGSALHTEVHAWVEGLLTTAHYTAPAGSYIDSVQMSLTNPGYVYSPIQTYVWIDDISGHYYPHAATQSAQLMAMPLMQEAEFVQADTHQVSAEVTLAGLYDGAHVQHATVVLNGNGQQTLSLTAEDILSNAQTDLFIHDGRQQLAINGDKGDVVELKVSDLAANGQWHDAGQVTTGGVQYEVYQHASSNAELLIQHGVELQHA